MKSVLVIGAGGYMGGGIVQACAQVGYSVHASDVGQAELEETLRNIERSVGKLAARCFYYI